MKNEKKQTTAHLSDFMERNRAVFNMSQKLGLEFTDHETGEQLEMLDIEKIFLERENKNKQNDRERKNRNEKRISRSAGNKWWL